MRLGAIGGHKHHYPEGEEKCILLTGADNTNVMAWTSKGYAKKGPSLTLNQETAKLIVKKKLIIEGFYLCSGRNFSADWLSRTDLDLILEWSHRMASAEHVLGQYGTNSLLTGSRIKLTTGCHVQFYWGGKSLDFHEFALNGIALEVVWKESQPIWEYQWSTYTQGIPQSWDG